MTGIKEARRRFYHFRRRIVLRLRRSEPTRHDDSPEISDAILEHAEADHRDDRVSAVAPSLDLTIILNREFSEGDLTDYRAATRGLGLVLAQHPASSVTNTVLGDDVEEQPTPISGDGHLSSNGEDATPSAEERGAAFVPRRMLTRDQLQALLGQVQTTYVYLADDLDRVLTDGATRVVAGLDQTGADYVTASISHTSPLGDSVAPHLTQSHSTRRDLNPREREHELIHDVGVANKIFRTDYLASVVRGIERAGEISLTGIGLAALCSAELVTVLPDSVVEQARPVESAEVRRALMNVEAIHARHDVYEAGVDALGDLQRTELIQAWRVFGLNELFADLYPILPRTGEAYWLALRAAVKSIVKEMELTDLTALQVHNRVLVYLIDGGHLADAEAVSYHRSENGSSYSIVDDGAQLVASPHYLDGLRVSVPAAVLSLRAEDLAINSRLVKYAWSEQGDLLLQGWAYIPGIGTSSVPVETHLILMDLQSGGQRRIPTTPRVDDRVDESSADPNASYVTSAFTATILREEFNLEAMIEASGGAGWTVTLEVRWGHHVIQAPFGSRDIGGAAGVLANDYLRDHVRLVPEFTKTDGLTLKTSQPKYVAESVVVHGRTLEVTVSSTTGIIAGEVEVWSPALKRRALLKMTSHSDEIAHYRGELPETTGSSTDREWSIRAVSPFYGKQPIAWWAPEAKLGSSSYSQISVETTGYGYLRLRERNTRILARSIRLTEDGSALEVTGTFAAQEYKTPVIGLVSGRRTILGQTELTLPADGGPSLFRCTIPLDVSDWGMDAHAPESGAYSLRFSSGPEDIKRGHWIQFSRDATFSLPLRLESDRGLIRVTRTAKNGAVKIDVRPSLSPLEETRFGQAELQREFFSERDVAGANRFEDCVLVSCYGGRKATDAPLELAAKIRQEFPNVPIYWGTEDAAVVLPPYAVRLIIGSREWYRVLASARVLINNNNFPYYFRKREGQFYVQTWHGTPLKRLVFDVHRSSFALAYWAHMTREASYWNALLAQDEFGARALANAFRFEGRMITEGYPRNDSLFGPAAVSRRDEVRARLGIAPDQKVALYAPTWRDNVKSSSNQYAMVTYLDFSQCRRALGAEWTFLLRGHHNIAAGRNTAGLGVIDVTDYPEVNDLYLAADVLINDYSSVMFDFAVTGKPIVFLAPDRASYSGDVRGFYFDYEAMAPGPIVDSTDEVIRELGRIDSVALRYVNKYREFVRQFVSLDDGGALGRVFAQLGDEFEVGREVGLELQ